MAGRPGVGRLSREAPPRRATGGLFLREAQNDQAALAAVNAGVITRRATAHATSISASVKGRGGALRRASRRGNDVEDAVDGLDAGIVRFGAGATTNCASFRVRMTEATRKRIARLSPAAQVSLRTLDCSCDAS